eukprot:m.241677 g.241677  ORF g.241677 m.241677 type:complete len:765 (+) comp25322_c0_seq1:43-2337(+)
MSRVDVEAIGQRLFSDENEDQHHQHQHHQHGREYTQSDLRVSQLKPTLSLCGRCSTRVASDDFACIELFPLLFSCGTVSMALLFGFATYEKVCSTSDDVATFAIMWVCVSLLCFVVQLLLICCSFRGTLSNDTRRRFFISFLFDFQMCLEVLQLVCLIYSAAIFQRTRCDGGNLPYDADTVVFVYFVMGFCVLPFKLLWLIFLIRNCFFHCYSPPKESFSDGYGTIDDDSTNSNASFRSFLKFMCGCCIVAKAEDKKQFWDELAEMFMEVLGNRTYTITDVVAGLKLVHSRQQHIRLQNESTFGAKPGSEWNIQDEIELVHDKEVIEEMIYFLNHAFATFTWMMECYLYGCKSLGRMCATAKRSSCSSGLSASHDCCRVARVSFLSQTNVSPDDVIHLEFSNSVYMPPFGVVLDRNKKALIISIRGTFSVSDLVTDGIAHVEELRLPNGMETPVHAGIHRSTKRILSALKEHYVFATAASKLGNDVSSYEVITTGHSLGSAIASLLSILLQFEDIAGFRHVRGFAFSPVPIVNMEVATWADSFLKVMTLGHDMVGRLHLQSLFRIKYEVDFALRHSDQKKAAVFCSIVKSCLFGCKPTGATTPYWEREDFSSYMSSLNLPEPLYIPGKIVHIIKHSTSSCCSGWCGNCLIAGCLWKKRTYGAFFTNRTHFEELVLSGRMAADHFPNPVKKSLKSALRYLENLRSGSVDDDHEIDLRGDNAETLLLLGSGSAHTKTIVSEPQATSYDIITIKRDDDEDEDNFTVI